MENKKSRKTLIIIICATLIGVIVLTLVIPFAVLGARSASIDSDYAYLKDDPNYNGKAEVPGVDLVTQHISCGYATIDMMSAFYGDKVTEDDLSDRNHGAISTQTSNGFLKELNRTVGGKSFVKRSYLKSDAFLKDIYASLAGGHPVAIEWAALYENAWTLHFSLVTGLDLANDNVTVYNPYGVIENVSLEEFISRTSFKSFERMPAFLSFGFAFGAFEKNTIFFCGN